MEKSKIGPEGGDFDNYILTAPSSAYSCFYFLVGDPKKGTPEKIAVSKLHLMAHSVPMRKMLDESEIAETETVPLEDIQPETFRNFVKFLSRGEIVQSLTFEEAVDLLYVAEKYIVEDLKKKLVDHIVSLITIDNVFLPMTRRECFQGEKLKNAIDTIIQQKTNDLVGREEFLQLDIFGMLNIVGQETLELTELELWHALLRWAKHKAQSEDSSKLREVLTEPMKNIRFCTLDPSDFLKEVTTTDILSVSEISSIAKVMGGKTEFVKTASICYELIKRDLSKNSQIEINFIALDFAYIDLAKSSYIYLTTKNRKVWLKWVIVKVVPTNQSNCYFKRSGKVLLTRITNLHTNTSSEQSISVDFSENMWSSTDSLTIQLSNNMKLLPDNKYKLEFSTSDNFKVFGNKKEDFVLDRNGLVVHLSKDCPVSHFASLTYETV